MTLHARQPATAFIYWLNIPVCTTVCGAAYTIYQLCFYPVTEHVDLISVLSEGIITLILLCGVFLLWRLRVLTHVYVLLSASLFFLFVASLSDTLDEWVVQPAIVTALCEDLFQLTGFALLVVSLYKWIIHNDKVTEQLQKLAVTDTLTNAYNRRNMNEMIHNEIERHQRYRKHLSVIAFDLDKFKQINDQYGHAAGDDVLVAVSKIVKSLIRKNDIFFRTGGDEFLLLTPSTELSGASILAERLREMVDDFQFSHQAPVSISLGIAEYRQSEKIGEFLQRADDALYRDKQQGANKTHHQ